MSSLLNFLQWSPRLTQSRSREALESEHLHYKFLSTTYYLYIPSKAFKCLKVGFHTWIDAKNPKHEGYQVAERQFAVCSP